MKIEDFLYKKHGKLFKREEVKEVQIKGKKAIARAKMAKTIRFDGDFKGLSEELKKLEKKRKKNENENQKKEVIDVIKERSKSKKKVEKIFL